MISFLKCKLFPKKNSQKDRTLHCTVTNLKPRPSFNPPRGKGGSDEYSTFLYLRGISAAHSDWLMWQLPAEAQQVTSATASPWCEAVLYSPDPLLQRLDKAAKFLGKAENEL